MERRADLGEFLRSRRARVKPSDVGLRAFGQRRVPGLRREELAQVAGVSVDYYVRLEQGRVPNVSTAVLDAIAAALQLDDAETAHLHNLARPPRGSVATEPLPVRTTLQVLLDALHDVPAYVVGRRTDVLAWNGLAAALLVDFGQLPAAERNWTRLVFGDDDVRKLFVDWEEKAADTVAYLRLDAGRHPDDPQLHALVEDLSASSQEFRHLWSAQQVKEKTHGWKRLRHPVIGELTLRYETALFPDEPDQALTMYVAEPGSPAARALQDLARMNERPAAVVSS